MGFASINNSGLSGLYAAQTALATASHNISNSTVEGYHRQRVVLQTQAPQLASGFFIGQGVDVQTVQRVADQFIDEQLRNAGSTAGYLETSQLQLGQVDSALSSGDASLLPAIQSFFSAVSGVAANPTSTPQRQLVLSNAQVLSERFAAMQTRMDSIRRGVEVAVDNAAGELNSYAKQLAQVNSAIVSGTLRASGGQPADLIDQRDVLVNKISGLINTQSVVREDGSVTVSIAEGKPLVDGQFAASVGTAADPNDPSRVSLTLTIGDGTVSIPDRVVTNGKLGALLATRNETLDYVDGQLGRLALVLTDRINRQQTAKDETLADAAFDLDGQPGQNFFTSLVSGGAALSSRTNTPSDIQLLYTVTDSSAVTGDHYRMQYENGSWRVTDGKGHMTDLGPGESFDFEGLNVQVGHLFNGLPFGPNEGDSFEIRPTAGLAAQVQVALDDPRKIAATSKVPDPQRGAFVGDGSNAQKMADLQRALLVAGGETLAESYAKMVGVVGVQAASAETRGTAQTALIQQLRQQQESVSGVNLDEEAANLLRYQQAYQASAKLLSIAGSLLDAILQL
jgi:flagellar hook-associated protein 1 FlgK